ncbi:MAG TPA: DUF6496 domain-containing protein [Vicinamibacterales bacterium]|nr:DUF6496 domain-containing protein [Vicinamibacterales bacterium]
MAKYGKKAQSKVKRAMHEGKHGTLTSGRSGRKVKSRKQAIAIGLSEARREGAKVPRKGGRTRKGGRKRKGGNRSRQESVRGNRGVRLVVKWLDLSVSGPYDQPNPPVAVSAI